MEKEESEDNYFYNELTANLYGADIGRVEFINAYLAGTDLRHSKLENVDFEDADLSNADLRHSKLENVDFEDADLSNADFRWAKIDNAGFNLSNAILDNADFSRTHVYSSKFLGAKSLDGTTVPKSAYHAVKDKFPNIIEGEDP